VRSLIDAGTRFLLRADLLRPTVDMDLRYPHRVSVTNETDNMPTITYPPPAVSKFGNVYFVSILLITNICKQVDKM
jgi:hypothetical protein